MSSLPASIKMIGSKTTEKRWRHHFPIRIQWGISDVMETRVWTNLPQNLMQPFPHPNDATHKIWSRLTNWLQRYRVWNFRQSRASTCNSKMSCLIWPKIELDRAFMPVLVTSNFDDDSIKMNHLAWRHHFPIISLWEMFYTLKGS